MSDDDIDADGRLTVRDLPPCLIRERITQACSLAVEKESGDDIDIVPVRPPGWLIDAVFRRGTYGGAVRPLAGVVQSPLETPEDRSGFRHPDLLSWIEAERPRLAVAALTILRAYFVAGCPSQTGGDWGSFERWSAVEL